MASDSLPRALAALWGDPDQQSRRSSALSRERIVAAAIELADENGVEALSMARLAERIGCGTMSLYRHVASKDDLLVFMLSAAPGPPPEPSDPGDWRISLTEWAAALWDVYHRHPWILRAAMTTPPIDPGQLAWLEAGLTTLRDTPLSGGDKLSSIMAVLHYVRGAAALQIESRTGGALDWAHYPDILRALIDSEQYPQVAAAVSQGAFDADPGTPDSDLSDGLPRILDGIAAAIQRGV